MQYCKRFNRFENPEAVQSVRELLQNKDLYEFEVGVIGNLVPENAAEAKALCPTLEDHRELEDEDIDAMLATLATFKTLQ
jgi:DNA-directed RNA polymerase subunit F